MYIKPTKFVAKLRPYIVTPQEPWLCKYNSDILKLDWNEGTSPPDFIKKIISRLIHKDEYWSWYPDYNAQKLHSTLSKDLDLSEMKILSFPGSDVALETICRAFISPNDQVFVVLPSYSNFITFGNSCGASISSINIDKPYEFDPENIIKNVLKIKPKILYLVSPNNPCGYVIEREIISDICKAVPNTLVICDQAYVEFSPESELTSLVNDFENLLITRTFSKAYSLAGIRIGYLLGSHKLLKEIAKIRNGKNISMLSQEIAIECIKQKRWLTDRVSQVSKGKELFYKSFKEINYKFYKSHANFVLFEPDDPVQLLAKLKTKKVFIRDQIKATSGGLRVTVSDMKTNIKFIEKLLEVIKNNDVF